MHILVINDDGPPSTTSSPYILDLVRDLQHAGHLVSVVLPHTQRSWIGKAHLVGQAVRPSYYRPPRSPTDRQTAPPPASLDYVDQGTTASKPLQPESDVDGGAGGPQEEWILVDSTPASCAQIGLFHYFEERGPVDLVLSGPNYGRNTTAVFALSSGTLGGALEAAVCGFRAIALSYAFFDRNHDPRIVRGASRASVKVVEALAREWREGVQVYSVNVPLIDGVEDKKVLWTEMLQNTWLSGSCFTVVDNNEKDWDPEEGEARIRRRESVVESTGKPKLEQEEKSNGGVDGQHLRFKHKEFKWSPRFGDVYKSVEEAPPGNDGWAVQNGFISVTPLKANFMHVGGFEGELKV